MLPSMLPSPTSPVTVDNGPIGGVATGEERMLSTLTTKSNNLASNNLASNSLARNNLLGVFLCDVARERSHWLRFVSHAVQGLPSTLRRALEPEDVLQEACFTAFKNQSSFQGQSALQFKRWFKMVILGTVRNLLRFHQRDKRIINVLSPSLRDAQNSDSHLQNNGEHLCVSPAPSPEQYLAMQEEIQRILEAIESLPPDQALLLLLVTVEELSLQEAAKELGISAQAASSRLCRARKNLEKLLQTGNRHRA